MCVLRVPFKDFRVSFFIEICAFNAMKIEVLDFSMNSFLILNSFFSVFRTFVSKTHKVYIERCPSLFQKLVCKDDMELMFQVQWCKVWMLYVS